MKHRHLKLFGFLETETRRKMVSFQANLVEFRVSKCSFEAWDTVSQLSRLQFNFIIRFDSTKTSLYPIVIE